MKTFLTWAATLFCCCSFTQSLDNNWVFGQNAGLSFSSGVPESFTSVIYTYEACASISDSSGNLLFYTNGQEVWNRNHEVMPNGDSLELGGINYIYTDTYASSYTQGVIIVPDPGNNNQYYIFQLQIFGFKYSKIDMLLDGGLGDVSQKNIMVSSDTTAEKMQVVKHANGKDWWLIVRKWTHIGDGIYDMIFETFLITSTGIVGPYSQDYGPDYDFIVDNDLGWGQMIFSQDGSKLLYTRGKQLDTYNFDRCSGMFSEIITIINVATTEYGSLYGCSFSPDGTKIYASTLCGAEKKLYQYCLNCEEPVDSTKYLVYDGPEGNYCHAQHLLGPDGKIYLAIAYNTLPNEVYSDKNQNLSVINEPNALGAACDFDTNTVSLGTNRVIFGLPNMPNYSLGALTGSPCDTLTAIQETETPNGEIKIYPNPASSFIKIQYQNTAAIKSITTTNYLGEKITISFDKNLQADISALPSGVYFTQIQTEQREIQLTWTKM